ncbi:MULTISPECIES: NAD(P)/FAD-dependent oxidoreductase [unclassified Streptomyces]|uniref:NAD(P)/FAD-dependent oxidoreductase n=1 Tax=unclassified Streptomyces TaxID=2593676 RepID=UPI0036F114BE
MRTDPDHIGDDQRDPDVTVLGTGITATSLAVILARHGLRVLLLGEHDTSGSEPGEMTLPCTSFLYEVIAERFRVPEIALLADAGRVGRELSYNCGVQRTLGFVHHHEGAGHRRADSLQFNIPSEHGESRFYRPDLDAWMLAAAVGYGARVRQRVRVDKAVAEDDRVRLTLTSGEEIRTRFVVDTGGPDSAVARALGAERVSGGTGTRVIGAHAVGVRPYERVAPVLKGSHPWSQGTLHHVFDGGWIQVGHFRNGSGTPAGSALATVTLSLDAARFPRQGTDGWEEILARAARHPAVAAQLADAQPMFCWTADSGQWHASRTVGDRMLLLDGSALGGDPVLGRDLYTSAQLVYSAASDILAAARDDDWSAGRFRYLERLQHGMADRQDRLVDAALTASSHPALWSATARVWLLGTMFDALSLKRSAKTMASGAAEAALTSLRADPATGVCHETLPEYRELLDFTLAACRDTAEGRATARQSADRIFVRLRNEAMVPPIYGFGDPTDREYVLTTPQRVRTLLWARKEAPPGVLRLVRPYGARGGGKDLGHDD